MHSQREAEEAVLREVEREHVLIFGYEDDYRSLISDREDMLFQAAVRREVENRQLRRLIKSLITHNVVALTPEEEEIWKNL